MEDPEFKSALDFAAVRDFAYPEFHPLHYGVAAQNSELNEEEQELDGSIAELDDDVLSAEPQRVDLGLDYVTDSLASTDTGTDKSIRSPNDIYSKAVALFEFQPENDNEIALVDGQVVWVSYRHGQGWLVAEDLQTGQTGLIPEEYVQLIPDENEWEDDHHAQTQEDEEEEEDV